MNDFTKEQLLEAIKDKEVRLTHEQILTVMDSWQELSQEQKDTMDDYFKRVRFSHPRWWKYPL